PARRGDDEDLAALSEGGMGPELGLLKARHAAEFNAAFAQAVLELPAKQRRLLRLHFVAGLGVARLGAELGMHQATAARQLQTARKAALEQTLRILRERPRLSEAEVRSLLGLVLSRLHVSLARVLGSTPDGD